MTTTLTEPAPLTGEWQIINPNKTTPKQAENSPQTADDTMTDEQRRQLLLERQAAMIADLQEQIRVRQEQVDQIKRRILATHQPGTYQAGGLKVQVREGPRRLNARMFTKLYPVKDNPDLYETKPKALSMIVKTIGERSLAPECVSHGTSTVVVA